MDTSDYFLSDEDFHWLESRHGPFSADLFALGRSFRKRSFFTKFHYGEAEGVDAFSVSWGRGFGYFHSPVGSISRVLQYGEKCRARGLLVVPDWLGSSYSMLLERKLREGRMKVVERFRLRLICPVDIVSDTFRGVLKFDFLIVCFNFNQI